MQQQAQASKPPLPQQQQQQRSHTQQPPTNQQQQLQQQPTQQPRLQQPQQQQDSYVGVLHQSRPGDKVHFCVTCQVPIAVYGRLMPCMHAFCLSCAADMPKCFICLADINRIERINHPVYMSAATLQSFRTETDLAEHTKKLYTHLHHDPAFAAGLKQMEKMMQQQQMQMQQR